MDNWINFYFFDLAFSVFVCCLAQVPAPKDISDEELLRLLEAEDPSGFRIPMSLGEPHAELDKGALSDMLVVLVKQWLFYKSQRFAFGRPGLLTLEH